MSAPLLVYGCGGHGKVVADAARAAGWDVIGFADDDETHAGRDVIGIPVAAIGSDMVLELCRARGAAAVVALGSNDARRRAYESLQAAGIALATVVHPAATVAPSASLGPGTVVFAGAVINPDTRIGANVIINTAASIDHDNNIGDHAHISPGVHTGGTVTIGEGTHVGIGAIIRNNIVIGAWSIIGAGAVVVRPIPGRVVAHGTPARVRRPT